MTDLESTRGGRLGESGFDLFSNVRAEMTLPNRFKESAHFRFFPRDLQLDPAIVEIAHPADDLKTFGYVLDRPAKTDALDAAFEENLERIHVCGGRYYEKRRL